jgi:hypothetical protein
MHHNRKYINKIQTKRIRSLRSFSEGEESSFFKDEDLASKIFPAFARGPRPATA